MGKTNSPRRPVRHRSEFRQDIISGEWVLFAPGRFHKKNFTRRKKTPVPPASKDIFRDPLKSVDNKIILEYVKGKPVTGDPTGKKHWDLLLLQNKYPAVAADAERVSRGEGIYPVVPGRGRHDLLVTRNYRDNFPRLSRAKAYEVFLAFRERYQMFFKEPRIKYVSILHNWGRMAGASVYHPHYQIIAIPLVPPAMSRIFSGAKAYRLRHGQCAHCAQIRMEKKHKKRVILESKYAIAFTPFVSHTNFEIRVIPKRHEAFFEDTPDAELADIAALLQQVLRKVEKNLGLDYNFYIRTPPAEKKEKYRFYHWHIKITPRWSIPAGFEDGTGIMVNVVDPDAAAKMLRAK